MRALLLLIVPILFAGANFAPRESKWVVDVASQLIIYGNTNINKFKCALTRYDGHDTLEFVMRNELYDLVFLRSHMTIPVNEFECGNDQLTSDFLETIQARNYPNIYIRFLSLSAPVAELRKGGIANSKVAITIAGVTKTYQLAYSIPKNSTEEIRLKGIQNIRFSDFDLTPPEKLFGLIKVQQSLQVEFLLHLRPVNQ